MLDSKEWSSHLKEAGFNEVCELTDNVDFCGGQSVIAAFADKCAVYPDLDEIKQELSDNIVSYMIPESIIIMDSFPYTSNGKIDRKKLPVYVSVQDEAEDNTPPETETEKLIAKILSEVSGLDRVGINTDFVRMGVDSLKGITFITKLQGEGIKINLSELYEHSSVKKLSSFVDERAKSDELLDCGEI